MKAISILTASFLMFFGCDGQKQIVNSSSSETKTIIAPEPLTMEYESTTRGSYLRATVINKTISVIKTREMVALTSNLSDAEWNTILDLYNNLNLKSLESLKAPSEARFYDGAPIAHFKVTLGTTTYQTTDFDGGNPPEQVRKIVEKIIALAEKQ